MVYFGFDPPLEIGKFCELCGQEHFNEGELCTKCSEREGE